MPKKSIEKVLKKHSKKLMAIKGVEGTGQGLSDGEPCITVFVSRMTDDIEEEIPDHLEGYPVRIEVTGGFHAQPK
ncbi:MAG TPA: hypothetical protein VKA68_15615 [bacterium]|nr:hypothetical protein [bacterium]